MKKAVSWLPALLWMGLIFALSAESGEVSGSHSGALADLLLALLAHVPGLSVSPDALHLLLRKGAHMAAYAVLALLDYRALRLCGARRPVPAAFLLALLYAAGDEFHQRFVPGRGPSVSDVMIDACGAALSLICLSAVSFLRAARCRQQASTPGSRCTPFPNRPAK